MFASRPNTIAEVARRNATGEDASVLYGDFLDAFYAMDKSAQQRSLTEEPPTVADKTLLVSLAATAEELARLYSLPKPVWTAKPCYFFDLTEALYGIVPVEKTDNETRQWFRNQSPPAFAKRNLFVSANALSRA